MWWFTSDTHYFHKNIIRYCSRPFSDVNAMNEAMIANWNLHVAEDDDVFFLGDFSFGHAEDTKEVFNRLVGRKHMIVGNHDKHHSKSWWKSLGFKVVEDYMNITIGRYKITLSHYPYNDPTNHRYGALDANKEPLLCGHVHEHWKVKGNMINVGVDQWNFTPVNEKTIQHLLEAMEIEYNVS